MAARAHRIPRAAASLLVALALAAGAVPALAQGDSLEAAKRKELEEIRRRAAQNREQAKRLQGRENQELVKLRRTERQLGTTRQRLLRLQRERTKLDQQLEVARLDLQRSLASLEGQRRRLSQRLRSIYKAGAANELEFLLSTSSFAQLLARWDYVVMVAEQDRLMLEQLRGRKEEVEANQQRLELNLDRIQTTARKTDTETRKLSALRQERETTVQSIQSQRKNYEAAAAELEKTARSIQRLLAELERKRREEAERAKAQGRTPQPYSGEFAKGQGQLDWPARGNVIGRFGNEVHPKWGTVTPNNGIDIEVPVGTGVRSVAKGRVDYVSDDYGTYGQMILINHGDGFYTMYAHLSSIAVSVGQEVTPGQVIARSGDSGSLKGPILHFEVRKGGTPLDPQDWLQ
jgi:septal ring factor EnvC (AmiA/AmiB activator)